MPTPKNQAALLTEFSPNGVGSLQASDVQNVIVSTLNTVDNPTGTVGLSVLGAANQAAAQAALGLGTASTMASSAFVASTALQAVDLTTAVPSNGGSGSATFVPLTQMAVTFAGSSRYRIQVFLSYTCISTIGCKVNFVASNGLTVTTFAGQGTDIVDIGNGVPDNLPVSSITTNYVYGFTGQTSGIGTIDAYILTNAGGTLTPQFASHTANNNATANVGTHMIVTQLA